MGSSASPALKPRILLAEDSPGRIRIFRKWIEGTEFVLIEASSAGRALGVLRKGMAEGIAGIALDQDLSQQALTEADLSLSGSNLVDAIAASVPRSVPILIHSMAVSKPAQMERRLVAAGYTVTRIGMEGLTEQRFAIWLEEVRDNWE